MPVAVYCEISSGEYPTNSKEAEVDPERRLELSARLCILPPGEAVVDTKNLTIVSKEATRSTMEFHPICLSLASDIFWGFLFNGHFLHAAALLSGLLTFFFPRRSILFCS